MNTRLHRKAKKVRENPSKNEDRLWNKLLKNNIWGYKFQRKAEVEGKIVDFYCVELRMIIEIDGTEKGSRKIQNFRKNGYRVLSFSSAEIQNLDLLGLKISQEIEK